jgi:uncharacterized protein with HEPN domain
VTEPGQPRTVKVLDDLLDAASAAAEIVARGRDAWDQDRLLRLAGEAVISRIGDAAARLPDQARAAMPSVPWDDIRANRILATHIYHRIDYAILWETLVRDVPALAAEIERHRPVEIVRQADQDPEREL